MPGPPLEHQVPVLSSQRGSGAWHSDASASQPGVDFGLECFAVIELSGPCETLEKRREQQEPILGSPSALKDERQVPVLSSFSAPVVWGTPRAVVRGENRSGRHQSTLASEVESSGPWDQHIEIPP